MRPSRTKPKQQTEILYFGLPWRVVLPLAILLCAILLVIIARLRLLNLPLERDEGEYAYIGSLMLQGVAPYGVAANMKLPGTNAAYALIMAVFGQTIVGIHLGFLLVNAGAVVLVFAIGRRLFGVPAGIAAAASYAVMTVGGAVLGLAAHATHFVVLAALGGTVLLLRWEQQRKLASLIGSGLLFGLAFVMKQPGILFPVFGLFYLIYVQRSRLTAAIGDAMVFGAAAILPFGVVCVWLWRAGVFGRFWLWVFTYARLYTSRVNLAGGLHAFDVGATPIFIDNPGLCVAAAAGMVLLWRRAESRAQAITLTLFLLCSFVAVCPGLYFRQHYFVLVLPAVALLIGAFIATWPKGAATALPLWLVAAALTYSIGKQASYLFELNPETICRLEYGLNPFPEALPIAEYIRARTKPDDRIVVLGSEPEIYFYAQRRSVTPYVYVYPLVEAQPLAALMQAEFIRDVEAGKPEYLVYVNVFASWLVQANSPAGIFHWARPYYAPRYEQVGVVELSPEGPAYRWDATAAGYQPRTSNFVLILKRKG